MLKSDSELFKIFCIFFFFWCNRFYGKPVSTEQANTKTCCKWSCATGVTSSCGWVTQCSLTIQRKGNIWLANKATVYISSSVSSRIWAWTITVNTWSSQNLTDINGILEVMLNWTLPDDCKFQTCFEGGDFQSPHLLSLKEHRHTET